MTKDILYLDFDNTIVDSIDAIVSMYNEDFQYYKNYKEIHGCDINTWRFEECSCATPEYINLYFNQPRFFERLEFMPWAKEIIEVLKNEYIIKIVTMGYNPNLIGKSIWISQNLPGTELISVDMKQYTDKSHIDMSDGILVDDSSRNLYTSNAKDKILFGDTYLWNSDWNGKNAKNWVDLGEYLLRGE